jgi:transcriptional regulator with XRE-family HTH domain
MMHDHDHAVTPVNLVQRFRRAAGLSQRQLAKRMGVAQSRVCRLEAQSNDLKISTLLRVAKAAGLRVTVRADPAVPR